MSAGSLLIEKSISMLDNMGSFFRMSYAFMKKTRPFMCMYENMVTEIKAILTANKKLKIARYRVTHLRYRLYQMETLMKNNNPNNTLFGTNMNQLR